MNTFQVGDAVRCGDGRTGVILVAEADLDDDIVIKVEGRYSWANPDDLTLVVPQVILEFRLPVVGDVLLDNMFTEELVDFDVNFHQRVPRWVAMRPQYGHMVAVS